MEIAKFEKSVKSNKIKLIDGCIKRFNKKYNKLQEILIMKSLNIELIKAELTRKVPEFARKIAPVYQILDWEWVQC